MWFIKRYKGPSQHDTKLTENCILFDNIDTLIEPNSDILS